MAAALSGCPREAIRSRCNWWGGGEVTTVSTPCDVLLLFQKREFAPYWFESATPTFLVEILKQRGVFTPSLDHWKTEYELLSQFDVDQISTEGLLFQTGYLTIQHVERPARPAPVHPWLPES